LFNLILLKRSYLCDWRHCVYGRMDVSTAIN
jgi:hypothetical protein